MTAERLAELFHASISRRSLYFQLERRTRASLPWEHTPDNLRRMLISSSAEVLRHMAAENAQEGFPHA